jgi:hypothetical protein
MIAISRALRHTAVGIVGILSISAVVIGCGESRPIGDAGTKGSGGSAGITGTGGSSGSGGRGGSGGSGIDGGLRDLNLDGLSFDLSGFDVSVAACPSNVKTTDACTANDKACLSPGIACLCISMKWNCFTSGSER